MNEISIGKKDIVWSYVAQFLSMGAGVITLPFILNRLSAEEIGLNYILITVGSVIALVDLGFAPQFARNFTYVLSGVQELKKEGIGKAGADINYRLLGYLLKTARLIYGALALFALILLLTVGTPYIYKTTEEFTNVPNALYIWIIYSVGVLFQIFYSYYFSMLLGAGKIKEQNIALIGNKIIYVGITIGGLYLGWGLISVALAQMISPFFGRIVSYRYFYTPTLTERLKEYTFEDHETIIDIFRTLWYNAKRVAVISIGGYAILRFSMFIAGLYLTLEEFASYGLMVQLVGIIGNVSRTYMQIIQPKLASFRASGNRQGLLRTFSLAYDIFLLLFIAGSMILVIWGPPILSLIKSNAVLPNKIIVTIYSIVMLLEYNHSSFASLISTDNKVPFAPASILTGIAVCIGVLVIVRFTQWGILGLVSVQGICQLAYQNWKWPYMALSDLNISYYKILQLGIKVPFPLA